jgi:hypothetical protein
MKQHDFSFLAMCPKFGVLANTLILCLVFAGCSGGQPLASNGSICVDGHSCTKTFESPEKGYSIDVPVEFSRWTTFSEGMTGPSYPYFTTPLAENQQPNKAVTIFYPSGSCSPSLTGTSEVTDLLGTNEHVSWGKLDSSQWSQDKAYPDALCKVPLVNCPQEEYWSGKGCQGPGSAYALCSEKDGKTVVICISQMTDDPQLAEDIFKTFRWTD